MLTNRVILHLLTTRADNLLSAYRFPLGGYTTLRNREIVRSYSLNSVNSYICKNAEWYPCQDTKRSSERPNEKSDLGARVIQPIHSEHRRSAEDGSTSQHRGLITRPFMLLFHGGISLFAIAVNHHGFAPNLTLFGMACFFCFGYKIDR
jgi:hypothetical protein